MTELPLNPQWEVHPAEVKDALDHQQELLLLDVRRPDEFARAQIEGSTLIPLHELEVRAAEIADWKNRRVVVLCHLGARSLRATAFLRHLGFSNVHSMAGGIDAYSLVADPSVPRY